MIFPLQNPDVYILALPLDSNGSNSTKMPAAMKSAPLTYTGALVSRLANMATMGAMIPKMRFAEAVMALPVPRSLVLKISGVYEYLVLPLAHIIQDIFAAKRNGSDNLQDSIHNITHEIVRAIPLGYEVSVCLTCSPYM